MRVAARVAERRPQDALGVDAVVGPERAVLRGDDGVLHVLRHLVERDRVAVLGGELAELGLAVGVVDVRRSGSRSPRWGPGCRSTGRATMNAPTADQRASTRPVMPAHLSTPAESGLLAGCGLLAPSRGPLRGPSARRLRPRRWLLRLSRSRDSSPGSGSLTVARRESHGVCAIAGVPIGDDRGERPDLDASRHDVPTTVRIIHDISVRYVGGTAWRDHRAGSPRAAARVAHARLRAAQAAQPMLGWGRLLSYGSLYPALKKMLRGRARSRSARRRPGARVAAPADRLPAHRAGQASSSG